MSRKSEDATIIGRKFTVQQLPSTRAYKLFIRLTRLAGPALGELLGLALGLDGGQPASLAQLDVGAVGLDRIGAAFQLLFEKLTPQEADEIRRELLGDALVDDLPLEKQFDDVFSGEVFGILELMFFALKVNFRSFSRARGVFGTAIARAKTKPASGTSTTSAGQRSE